jgi:hypothetical protein
MTAVAVTKASTPVRLRRVNVERVLSVSAGSTLGFLGISANAACAALGIAGVLIFCFGVQIFMRSEAVKAVSVSP